jgi:hypothetical protein
VMPTAACDRRLDGGDQQLGYYPFITRLHCQFGATSGVPSGVRLGRQ